MECPSVYPDLVIGDHVIRVSEKLSCDLFMALVAEAERIEKRECDDVNDRIINLSTAANTYSAAMQYYAEVPVTGTSRPQERI